MTAERWERIREIKEIDGKEGDWGGPVVGDNGKTLRGIHVGAEQGTKHCFFAPSWIIAEHFGVTPAALD